MVDPMRTAIFADANIEVHRDAFNRGELFRLTKKPPQQAAFLRETLLAIPMCEDVNDQQLERLVGAMELVRLQPREVCVRAGTPNPFMYVVAAGRVSLTRPKPGPEEHIGPGAIFGQEALARSAPADFTAVAGGGCAVFRLHRAAFKLLQVDYGMRLRAAIGSVMGQRRQEQQAGMSAMQLIVMQAQQKRMEQKRLAEAHPEFADVPAALGSCQDVATLGKGNFGEVRLVVHQPTKTAYALKQQASDQEKREAIDREIAAMRACSSPFMIHFYGELDEQSFGSGFSRMLLEYLGGGSLNEVMATRGIPTDGGKRAGFDLPTARFYFACALSAIDAMHGVGWMHRDVKLENVVIDCDGYAKLIDCGLSKPVAEHGHTFTMTGTPCYYAPEMIKHMGYGHKVCAAPAPSQTLSRAPVCMLARPPLAHSARLTRPQSNALRATRRSCGPSACCYMSCCRASCRSSPPVQTMSR